MALGTATVGDRVGHDARPVFFDRLSFAGDGAYPTGGTAAFEAYVQAAVARGSIDVLAVIGQDCGGYVPVYDKANNKLKVYTSDGNASPLVEVTNATNLSGVTFVVLVVSV